MKISERITFFIGLILLFGGLNLAILLSHLSRFYGLALIIAGLGLLIWTARNMEKTTLETKRPDNLASRIVRLITLNGRLTDFLPALGVGIIITVLAFNLFLSDGFRLGSNDYVALFLAGILLAYNYVPSRYSIERDFAFLFGILLFVFLVIPTTMLSMGGGEADTNSPLTFYFLAMPTAGLVRLLGVPIEAPFMDAGTPIYNMMVFDGPDGFPINLSIALSCSGLYSVAIFVSAFIAFVAVEYRKADRKVVILLVLGVTLAWLANIIRMALIVLVGRYYGPDTMQWVHNNIGEFIFMAWVSLFWWLMFGYFGVLEHRGGVKRPQRKNKGKCPVCSQPLSPTIPSVRCECGAISHSGCILTNEMRCPSCGISMDLKKENR